MCWHGMFCPRDFILVTKAYLRSATIKELPCNINRNPEINKYLIPIHIALQVHVFHSK